MATEHSLKKKAAFVHDCESDDLMGFAVRENGEIVVLNDAGQKIVYADEAALQAVFDDRVGYLADQEQVKKVPVDTGVSYSEPKKTVRKCSKCGEAGHTKNKCPN